MYRLLDLFCCEGGASRGYELAGFDVTGVDIYAQPKYPGKFIRSEALTYLNDHAQEYDAIHASPPCQVHSLLNNITHYALQLDYIRPTRDALRKLNKPYIIENVERAPLFAPILLCGAMFGLRTYRHRIFECSFPIVTPKHPRHAYKIARAGRPPKDNEYVSLVGNFSNIPLGREIMQMPWASRYGLAQAVPPAYTRYIGAKLHAHLEANR